MRYIHCLNNISHYGTDLLSTSYELTENIELSSGILVRSASLHDMEFPPDLLAIARAGAGVNNIPLDRCAQKGIVVFNTPGANANAVKELVLCGLFLGSRDIAGGMAWCKENADDENIAKAVEKAKKAFAGREIYGKKLGVIGLGAIGAKVANAALDLGMEVYGYDPYVSVGAAWQISSAVHHTTNLDDIYQTCDYLTIHVPALEGTIGMIDAHACSLMKDGAVLLNFSRDTLVNNEDVVAALESGKLHAYITDFPVFDLMHTKGVIAIPHLGASTEEAEDNCAVMAVREIMDYLENGNIKNSVNYPACDMGTCKPNCSRIAVLHQNIAGMISQITGIFGEEGVNVADLTNKGRDTCAYTLLDLEQSDLSESIIEKLAAIEGVYRVRRVH